MPAETSWQSMKRPRSKTNTNTGYGSTMLGEYKPNVLVKEVAISNGNITIPTLSATNLFSRSLSKREYTVNDHLSSVRSVLSDKKFATITGGAPTDFTSEILSVSNMYAGGMLQPGRSYNSADYSWGYQGQLKVDEIAGVGKHYTAEFWEYDPLTGRRWNRDQINKPWESPYAAFANNPIWFVDPTGMDTFRIDRNQQLQIIRGGEDALFIETAVKEKEIDEERDRFILQHGTSEQIRDLQFEFAYQQYDIEGIKDIFATVMSESSENLEESEGITNVLLNRARLQGISPERFSPETFNQIGGSGIYGRLNTTYNTANQMSFEEFFAEGFERSQTVKGVLNAFSGWRSDVSGGAYFWEGVTPYSQVGNYFRTRIEVANNRTPIFQINRTLGQTHFIQYNPQHTTYRRSIWP
ncbi:MAG: hypothetical protein HYY40_05430 [Bacteroidetes bacterium]|nr:hypothetical protein [Bacteroidota bacterium]